MQFNLSAPSKTFLVGEYLALEGGPSLVAATGPRFGLSILEVESPEKVKVEGISPLSPAGKWIRDHQADFSRHSFEFCDPHNGKGGFGASTAQFLFVFAWSKFLECKKIDFESLDKIQEIWSSYREYGTLSDTPKPSGADLIAQLVGGISSLEWHNDEITELKTYCWDFEEQSFSLFRTGTKVRTHEHLRDLKAGLKPELKEALLKSSLKAKKALYESDAFNFLIALQEYYKTLNQNQLVAPHTQVLVDNFYQSESVLGVKGCGALGADVLFVLSELEKANNVKALAGVVGLELVSTSEDMSSGLELSMSMSAKKNIDFKSISAEV
ncbi:MAG: hypothetical protein KDD50_06955 [Bdellovibrionales bacterium]|nr:hypothetical protein [Bdellovibrionales bacterium]